MFRVCINITGVTAFAAAGTALHHLWFAAAAHKSHDLSFYLYLSRDGPYERHLRACRRIQCLVTMMTDSVSRGFLMTFHSR